MVDALFFEAPKDNREKGSIMESGSGKTGKSVSLLCGGNTTAVFHDGAFKNHRQPIAGVRKGGIGWGGRAPLHRKDAPFPRHYGFLLSFPSYAVTFSHGTGYSP